MASERKKQVRFNEKDDVMLLREVLARNPFKEECRWNEIADTLPLAVDTRRVRERTFLLIKNHNAAISESQKQSGINEEHGEKEQILDEITELQNEEERQKTKQKERAKDEELTGKEIRKRAMETLSRSDDEDAPTPQKKPSNQNILSYLREKKRNGNKKQGEGARDEENGTRIEKKRT